MNRIGGPKYSTVDDMHMEKDLKNRTQHIYISHDNVYRQNSICESMNTTQSFLFVEGQCSCEVNIFLVRGVVISFVVLSGYF